MGSPGLTAFAGHSFEEVADATVMFRLGNWVDKRTNDAFKLFVAATEIWRTSCEHAPETERFLKGVTGNLRVVTGALDAARLPTVSDKFLRTMYATGPKRATWKQSVRATADLIDTTVKTTKFFNLLGVVTMGSYKPFIVGSGNIAGTYICMEEAIKNFRKAFPSRRGEVSSEEAPSTGPSSISSKQVADFMGLVKNVARVALNVLSFSAVAFGVALWSPLMLGLSTIGLVCAAASHALKQQADIEASIANLHATTQCENFGSSSAV